MTIRLPHPHPTGRSDSGEPHYAHICTTDKLKPLNTYAAGTDPATMVKIGQGKNLLPLHEVLLEGSP